MYRAVLGSAARVVWCKQLCTVAAWLRVLLNLITFSPCAVYFWLHSLTMVPHDMAVQGSAVHFSSS